MNRKTLAGLELKVEFAKGERRSFSDRGRGFQDRGRPYQDRGDRGDRGSFRGRPYDPDRPRRDFGDRPRGCFNCGEEGHMIKDCSKPRKPREFNNGPREGGFSGARRYDDRGGREERGGRDDRDRRGRQEASRSRSRDRRSRSKSGDHKQRRRRSPSSSKSR